MIKTSVIGLQQLRAANRKLERSAKDASRRRVRQATKETKLAARRGVKRIFSRNNRVSNAVRSRHYDNRAGGDAGVIYDKFGRRVRGRYQSNLEPYITGRPIRARRRRFMVIWLGRGKRRAPDQVKGLVSVKTPRGIFLVKQTRTRTRLLFKLVREVRPRGRLRPVQYLRRSARAFPRRMQQDIERSV